MIQSSFNTPETTDSESFRTPRQENGTNNTPTNTPTAPKKRKMTKKFTEDRLTAKKSICGMLEDLRKDIDSIKQNVETILDHHRFNRKQEIVEDEVLLHSKGYGLAWDTWLKDHPEKKFEPKDKHLLPILHTGVEVQILDYLLEIDDPMIDERNAYRDSHDISKCSTTYNDADGNINCGCLL